MVEGRAEVVADGGATGVRVEVLTVGSRPLHVARDGGQLHVGYDGARLQGWVDRLRGASPDAERAIVRVVVPTSVQVDVATIGAEADVSGAQGPVVKTVTGAVRASGTSGTLSLKTISGDASATGHTGDVSASLASGALALDGALGRVTVHTVSGPVRITGTGTSPMVDIKSVAGPVEVHLDAGTPVNLRVRAMSGNVVLDGAVLPSTGRPFAVDHAEAPTEGRSPAYVSAALTTGTVTVTRS
jgi:hypothetical protein